MMRIQQKNSGISVGDAVVSVQGRDKTKIYIVASLLPNGYLLCADGKGRKISSPKRKSVSHVRKLKTTDCPLTNDEDVANSLKQFEKLDFSVIRQSYYKPKRGDYSAER